MTVLPAHNMNNKIQFSSGHIVRVQYDRVAEHNMIKKNDPLENMMKKNDRPSEYDRKFGPWENMDRPFGENMACPTAAVSSGEEIWLKKGPTRLTRLTRLTRPGHDS